MFSISSTEFPELPVFIDKVRALQPDSSQSNNPDNNDDTQVHELRAWCAERGFILHFSKTPSSGTFYTLKYDRAKLTEEQYSTVGRFRSVVFDSDGRICCVGPAKMLKLTEDILGQPVNSVAGHLTAEEMVEGVMVNLFWQAGAGKWLIATKSCVSEVSFDHVIEAQAEAQTETTSSSSGDNATTVTFQKLTIQEVLRRRICEVLSLLPGGLDTIPKEYCYSLVIQHPKNQIVNVITVPRLYVVAVFQLSEISADAVVVGVNAVRINRDIFSANFGGSVSRMPVGLSCVPSENETETENDTTATATFTPHTVSDYCRMYASVETQSVSLPGVVFVDSDTGFCYKARNPKYENVKKRKGMEQKLMTQYLHMRKDHGIDTYLKEHPQHARTFRQFRDRLHDYTHRLYDSYIAHYVKKDAKPLKEYDRELKTHMYKLHYDIYLATMKESGVFVTKNTVIQYVNQLAVAQQLACLNASASVSGVESDIKTRSFPPSRSSNITGSGSGGGSGNGSGGSGGKTITRASTSDKNGSNSGFRSAKPSRGGRMVPSLTVHIPDSSTSSSGGGNSDMFASQVKGAKTTGSIKVQNQFAGLEDA